MCEEVAMKKKWGGGGTRVTAHRREGTGGGTATAHRRSDERESTAPRATPRRGGAPEPARGRREPVSGAAHGERRRPYQREEAAARGWTDGRAYPFIDAHPRRQMGRSGGVWRTGGEEHRGKQPLACSRSRRGAHKRLRWGKHAVGR
jgi:hypothetical protein